MTAWYFAPENNRLRNGDNREIVIGGTHTVECDPVLCEQGLHASKSILDALQYATGPMLYRVHLGGRVVYGNDKCAATERSYIWGFDASELLRKFARMCALDVIDKWDAPEIVVRYLKTGNENIQAAARDAARSAARAAARAAAWSAALAAARDAARDAAWDAALDAAWDAALDAAWSAALAAARDAARAAARDAARAAAWSAARAAQNKRLLRMVYAAKKELSK